MTLADADRALQAGDLKQAIVVHEALLQKHGPQADLYYNLGLLYGASEDWALSVLNLERAQTLDPDALDIKPHLTAAKEALGKSVLAAHADRKITQGEPKVFAMWRFFGVVGPQTAGVILLSAWLLGFGALIGRRFVKGGAWRDVLMVATVLGWLTAGVTGAYAVGQSQTRDVRPAMVLKDNLRLYNAPMKSASTEAHDDVYRGAVVRVLSEREEWRQVALADGTEGWLLAEDLGDLRVDRWTP